MEKEETMKNLTDYFQSLELVRAGVPKESADYYYINDTPAPVGSVVCQPQFPFVPCWSWAALWEFIRQHGVEFDFGSDISSEGVIEVLVRLACKMMKHVETK